MMKYNEWKLLTESAMPGFTLGLSRNPTVGGLVGSQFQEAGFGKDHDEEDEDDDDDIEGEDDDFDGDFGADNDEDDEEGLEGDLFGSDEEDGIKGSEEGPDLGFPPDDSEDMDGIDAAAGGDDDMGGILGDIDPELAGLGGDEMGGGDDLAGLEGELGGMEDDMGGLEDEMGDLGGEMGGMEDELGGLEGGMDDLGMDMGDEMGDMDMGMGDELGDEMGELGDEMGAEEPCPDCNPDGAEEEGDPNCELCGGMGFVGPEGHEHGIDAEMESPEEAQMADFMRMMSSYQSKYMGKGGNKFSNKFMKRENTLQVMENPLAAAGPMIARAAANPMVQQAAMGAASGVGQAAGNMMNRMTQPQQQQNPNQQMMRRHQKKFMTKIAGDDNLAARHGGTSQAASGAVRRPNHPISVKARSFMSKDDKGCNKYCRCESIVGTTSETHDDFLANLSNNARGEVRQKFSSGLVEDALFQIVDPNANYQAEPQAGDVGFAPSGRVGGGAIGGGGYTQDDITGIPTLGESQKRFPTLTEYLESKNR